MTKGNLQEFANWTTFLFIQCTLAPLCAYCRWYYTNTKAVWRRSTLKNLVDVYIVFATEPDDIVSAVDFKRATEYRIWLIPFWYITSVIMFRVFMSSLTEIPLMVITEVTFVMFFIGVPMFHHDSERKKWIATVKKNVDEEKRAKRAALEWFQQHLDWTQDERRTIIKPPLLVHTPTFQTEITNLNENGMVGRPLVGQS